MELLNIEKKEKQIIRIFGVDYEVKRLTWGAAKKYKQLKGDSEDDDEVLFKMLVASGLPEDVLLELAPDEIELVVNALMGTKKK